MKKFTEGKASRGALEQFLSACAAENPNRRLRLTALADRVSMTVDRASFDDLVTLVTQAPTWDKDRSQGVRTLLRALGEGKVDAPEQILARWTWRLARATRKVQDRRASGEFPEAKRLLGALANSRGHRHEENAAKLVNAALDQPREVGRSAARLRRGLHAAREQADRRRTRAARDDPGGRERARRQPARAEGCVGPLPPAAAQAQEEGRSREGAGQQQQQQQRQDGAKPERETAPAAEA